MSVPMILDLIFLAVFAGFLLIGWFKGAFRILAGLVGTVAGFIGSRMLTPVIAPKVAAFTNPTVEGWVTSLTGKLADSTAITESLRNALQGTELMATLEQSGSAQQFWTSLEQAVAEYLQGLAASLQSLLLRYADTIAPVITFLLLFILIKMLVRLICNLLSLDIPVLAQLNHLAGGAVGLAGGVLTVALICAGIIHFGGSGSSELLSLTALQESAIGGFFFRLFG